MRQLLAPLFLLSGVAAASACGGAVAPSGDSEDGDAVGSGRAAGDSDLPAAGGNGSATGRTTQVAEVVCEPGAVRLCDAMAGDDACTGIQLCASEGSAWEACLCPSGVVGDIAESAGGAGGADPSDDPAEASCPDVMACGGEVAGQWEVSSSCLSVRGTLDLLAIGLGCSGADVSGALQVSGRWTLSEGGQLVDDTTTVGSVALGLAEACLDISGTEATCDQVGPALESAGFSSVQCLDSPNGGCVCAGKVDQAGGMGHIGAHAFTHGEYGATDESLTVSSSDPLTYSYCAEEGALVVTPTGSGTTHGTIVLELARDQSVDPD